MAVYGPKKSVVSPCILAETAKYARDMDVTFVLPVDQTAEACDETFLISTSLINAQRFSCAAMLGQFSKTENKRNTMRDVRGNSLSDRLQNKSEAKQALLDRLSKMPKADDPEVLARKAARTAAAEQRRAEKIAREAARVQVERERIEREEAERQAHLELQAKLAREEADRQVALLAEQKAARDARYAARKKRKA